MYAVIFSIQKLRKKNYPFKLLDSVENDIRQEQFTLSSNKGSNKSNEAYFYASVVHLTNAGFDDVTVTIFHHLTDTSFII